jgi:hypothetical protein
MDWDRHDSWNAREDDSQLTGDGKLLFSLLVDCQHRGSTCHQVKESFSANSIQCVNIDHEHQCRSDDVVHKKHIALKEGHLDINSLRSKQTAKQQ